MGRKKTYDRDALIGKALELFRDHGYAGTSTQMLVETLGVNRFSLYNEFGSKQGIFDAVLQRYDDEVVERNFCQLEGPDGGLEEIRAVLRFFGAAGRGPAAGRGCLLCNTAVELGPQDPGGQGLVQRYFQRLSRAFRLSLDNAARRGQLGPAVDTEEEASFLTASVLGMFVLLRARAPAELLDQAARAAIHHVDSLCEPRSAVDGAP